MKHMTYTPVSVVDCWNIHCGDCKYHLLEQTLPWKFKTTEDCFEYGSRHWKDGQIVENEISIKCEVCGIMIYPQESISAEGNRHYICTLKENQDGNR